VIFTRPAGLAIDAADNLYVVDSEARAVLVFDKKRRPLRTIGGPEELVAPAYIAIDAPRAKIYVSDPRANKIVIYDRFGKKSGEIGGSGYTFSSPQGMAIDKAGNLYVAELLGARISVFDAQGNYLRSFGERGDKAYQFEAPRDLAFDSDGNLWVADIRRAQIYTYTPEGVLLLATGTSAPSSDPLGFSTPTAITLTADDTILVTDRVNRRFSMWRYFSESYLKEHPFTAAEEKYLRELRGKIVAPPAAVEVVSPQGAPAPGLRPPSP
jgi:DNA-binding beta-propeller fold protein YncE